MTSGGVPLLLRLDGRRAVVVGAGPVAAAKVDSLLEAGAAVDVIAPDAVPALRDAAAEGRLRWHRRAYAPGDLAGAALAVAAANDARVDAAVAAEADAAGVPCVRVDGRGSAAFMGSVRRGPLLLAAATDGAAPALAAVLRERLADDYGPEWGALATLMGELRRDPVLHERLGALPAEERRRKWRSVVDANILNLLRNGQSQAAREVAFACLSSSSD